VTYENHPVLKGLDYLLGKLTYVMVTKWGVSNDSEEPQDDERHEVDTIDEANVVMSKRSGFKFTANHALLLDLDVPAWLVPSSTPGHSHLYVDVSIPESKYFDLLDALADANVIQKQFAQFAKERGGTTLRLPWVKKGDAPAPDGFEEAIW
jgi:hypothetical protein